MMKKAEVEQFFSILAAQNPAPRTELHYSNPFTLLIAVLLSAQATDIGVNKATPALFATADNPAAMHALGIEAIKQHIKTIGLFNSKAANIMKLCSILLEKYNSAIPNTREELEQLPGVGRKTANVVLNEAFGMPTIAVDTHIFRVANRTAMAKGTTPLAVENQLEKKIPAHWKQHAHHWLILHGRYVCKARTPQCDSCLVAHLCKKRI